MWTLEAFGMFLLYMSFSACILCLILNPFSFTHHTRHHIKSPSTRPTTAALEALGVRSPASLLLSPSNTFMVDTLQHPYPKILAYYYTRVACHGVVASDWLAQAQAVIGRHHDDLPPPKVEDSNKPFSIIDEFNSWWKHPDLAEAVVAFRALALVIWSSQATIMMELEIELKKVSDSLKNIGHNLHLFDGWLRSIHAICNKNFRFRTWEPFLDDSGSLIRINTTIYPRFGASFDVGFSIPVDIVSGIVDQLVRFGKVTRPILGIMFAPYQSMKQLEVSEVLVYAVNGSVSKVGLLPTKRDAYGRLILGDIIIMEKRFPMEVTCTEFLDSVKWVTRYGSFNPSVILLFLLLWFCYDSPHFTLQLLSPIIMFYKN